MSHRCASLQSRLRGSSRRRREPISTSGEASRRRSPLSRAGPRTPSPRCHPMSAANRRSRAPLRRQTRPAMGAMRDRQELAYAARLPGPHSVASHSPQNRWSSPGPSLSARHHNQSFSCQARGRGGVGRAIVPGTTVAGLSAAVRAEDHLPVVRLRVGHESDPTIEPRVPRATRRLSRRRPAPSRWGNGRTGSDVTNACLCARAGGVPDAAKG